MNVAITNEVQQGVLTFNDCLTLSFFAAILSALSPSLVAVRGESRKNQEMPIQARLICRLRYSMQEIIYGGRYLGSFGSHGSLAMSLNPNNVHRPTFERVKRCLLTFKRDHTMLHHQSAPNAQSPIVLNPRTLAKAMELLEHVQNHAGNLSLQYDNHSIAPDLTMLECEIAQAYDMLSRVIMSGVKKSPLPAKTSPEEQSTPSKRQTTGHRLERDGAGYDCRVLLDDDGQYTVVGPTCTPPAGYRQVCIKCGHDRFMLGVTYSNCPECRLRVVRHCRYVAIAGGK